MTTTADHPAPAAAELTPDERTPLLLVLASQTSTLSYDTVMERLAELAHPSLDPADAAALFWRHREREAGISRLLDGAHPGEFYDDLSSAGDDCRDAAVDRLALEQQGFIWRLANGG